MKYLLNSEPKHIVFLGRKGVGKSSLINAFLGGAVSPINDGTNKNLFEADYPTEFLPYGPVVLKHAINIDDCDAEPETKNRNIIRAIAAANFAILVLDARERMSIEERKVITHLLKLSIPFLIAVNKIEFCVNDELLADIKQIKATHFEISCAENVGIDLLKSKVTRMLTLDPTPVFIKDIINPGDIVLIIEPLTNELPARRFMAQQIKMIREALIEQAIVIVTREKELRYTLFQLKNPPDLIISDNRSIKRILPLVNRKTRLTTFTLLDTRYKSSMNDFMENMELLTELKDGDRVLIVEACQHHLQINDIGREKLARWLTLHTKKRLVIHSSVGEGLPENITEYKLLIHCGGCMLTRNMMQTRIKEAKLLDVPIINYGVLIPHIRGSIDRIVTPFNQIASI